MSAATEPEVVPGTQHDSTVASDVDLKAGRRRVARSRGVLSGVLLSLLGAWAALAPFIGPYFTFGFEPRSGDAWHWTSGRGLYEVLPGGVTVLAGLVLLFSSSRVLTVLMAWLAALAGAWLVVAPAMSTRLHVALGAPPSNANADKTVALQLLYFFATGAAIAVVAGIAIGRLSVHSIRDVRAAERRAEAEAAAAAAAETQRREHERFERERVAHERAARERAEQERAERDRAEQDRAATGTVGAAADTRRPETIARDHAEPAGAHDHSATGAAAPDTPTANHPAVDHNTPTTTQPAVDHRAPTRPADAPADPAHATPPPHGGLDQYRYPTTENPPPPRQ